MDFLQTIFSQTSAKPLAAAKVTPLKESKNAGDSPFGQLLLKQQTSDSEPQSQKASDIDTAPKKEEVVALAAAAPAQTESPEENELTAEMESPAETAEELRDAGEAPEALENSAEPLQPRAEVNVTEMVEAPVDGTAQVQTKPQLESNDESDTSETIQVAVTEVLETVMDADLLLSNPEMRDMVQEIGQKLLQAQSDKDSDYAKGLEWMIDAMNMQDAELEEFVQFLHMEGAHPFLQKLQSDLTQALVQWESKAKATSAGTVENLLEALDVQEIEVVTETTLVEPEPSDQARLDSLARLILKLDQKKESHELPVEAEKESSEVEAMPNQELAEGASEDPRNFKGSNQSGQFSEQDDEDPGSRLNLIKRMHDKGFSRAFIAQFQETVTTEAEGSEIQIVKTVSQRATTQILAKSPQFVTSSRVIVQQVSDQIQRLAPPEVTKIRMVMKPENLGELRLEMKQENGKIKVTIETHSQSIKEVLERGMHQVRESIRIPGGEQAEIKVIVREDGFSGLMQDGRRQGTSQQKRGSSRDNDQQFSDEMEIAEEVVALTGQGSRVDLAV